MVDQIHYLWYREALHFDVVIQEFLGGVLGVAGQVTDRGHPAPLLYHELFLCQSHLYNNKNNLNKKHSDIFKLQLSSILVVFFLGRDINLYIL